VSEPPPTAADVEDWAVLRTYLARRSDGPGLLARLDKEPDRVAPEVVERVRADARAVAVEVRDEARIEKLVAIGAVLGDVHVHAGSSDAPRDADELLAHLRRLDLTRDQAQSRLGSAAARRIAR
jgi:hypothetical protein